MITYLESFLAFEVRMHNARLVFGLRVLAYNRRQVLGQRIDMGMEQRTVLLVQRGYARIHIHIVLRHTAGQQTAVAVQYVTACRRNRPHGRHLFLGHLEPFVALHGLHVDDLAQYGEETDQDENKNDGKPPNGVSLFVRHLS